MKNIILALTLSFIALSHVSLSQLSVGDKAPINNEPLKNANGPDMSLASAMGPNGLLVIFSCNTCPFVVGMGKEGGFPGWEKSYNDLYKLAKEKGFGVILLNSNEAKRGDEDSFEEMVKRANDKNYSMPYLVDPNSRLADLFGAKTTPHIYLMNEQGEIIYTGSIDNTWDPKRKTDIPYLINALQQFADGILITTSEPRGCSIKRVSTK